MHIKEKKHQNAFTLVEVIIVLAIFGLIIPSVFSIITSIIRQQADIYRLIEMKRQGDYALEYVKQKILNDAEKIYQYNAENGEYTEVCTQNELGNNFFETQADKNGNDFRMSLKNDPNTYFSFYVNDMNILQYVNTSEEEKPITSELVYIPYFHIECHQKTDFVAPLISIQFAIVYKNQSGEQVKINPLIYQTKIKLKQ